jgi:hypothetical protein
MNGKYWSESDISFLKENKGKMSSQEIGIALDRSVYSINRKIQSVGITKKNTGTRLFNGMKRCSKCEQDLSGASFSNRDDRIDGKDPWCISCQKDRSLSSNYGISIEQYNKMHATQKGKCLICLREEKLFVDHCHGSGTVRGLLCSPCNLLLGMCNEDPRILGMAVSYLKSHGKRISTMGDGSALSSEFLIARKKCCGNGCRNCPY